MSRSALVLVALLALTGAASAQTVTGDWECHGAAPADPSQTAPHGLLAIYGQSYTYASSDFQDPVSGDGDVAQQQSGVVFQNGPLVSEGGVKIGQINLGAGPLTMSLSGDNGVIFTCLAMAE